jgi:hypothetical protein
MARKITSGKTGRPLLGEIFTEDNIIKSILTDANVELHPNGNGIVISKQDLEVRGKDSSTPGKIRIADNNDDRYVALQAPDPITDNTTFTLPGSYPAANGYALKSTTSGVMSWAAESLDISDRSAADNNTYYIAMTSSSSGTSTTLNTAADRFSFAPNPGKLTVKEVAITGTTESTTVNSGALVIDGGIGVEKQATINNVSITATTQSTTSANGALIVAGGVGIAKDINCEGTLFATTKSFVINHPTKENHKLRYGSLEGPENGVYVRGRTKGNTIELPEYWEQLVDENSVTVSLTPIGSNQNIWVESISNNTVIIGGDLTETFYVIYGERKDVDKLVVEYEV